MEDASPVEGPCADGMELFRAQEYCRAEPLLVRCAEEEGRIEPMVLLTVITVMTERFDEAVTWGKRAVDLGPQEADARYWYGRALLVSGDSTRIILACWRDWRVWRWIRMKMPRRTVC